MDSGKNERHGHMAVSRGTFRGGGGVFSFPILKELKGLEQFGEAHGPRDFSAASASSRALSVWWVWGGGMEG